MICKETDITYREQQSYVQIKVETPFTSNYLTKQTGCEYRVHVFHILLQPPRHNLHIGFSSKNNNTSFTEIYIYLELKRYFNSSIEEAHLSTDLQL